MRIKNCFGILSRKLTLNNRRFIKRVLCGMEANIEIKACVNLGMLVGMSVDTCDSISLFRIMRRHMAAARR